MQSQAVNSGKLAMEEIAQDDIIKDISVCVKELTPVKNSLNNIKSKIDMLKNKDKELTK